MLTTPYDINHRPNDRFSPCFKFSYMQTSIVRTTLRNDLGMRIVEVDNEAATLEGTDVLFTG